MIRAFVGIKVGVGWFYGEPAVRLRGVKEEVAKVTGVKETYGVFGRFDIIAVVEAESLDTLTTTVIDKIRTIPSVQSTETLVISF